VVVPPVPTSPNFSFFGASPLTVIVPFGLRLVPMTVRMNRPLESSRVTLHDARVGSFAVVEVAAVHLTVTWIPCSLPIGHVPLAADRLRLVPLGPPAKITDGPPPLPAPQPKNTPRHPRGDSTTNLVACITCAEFAMFTANTDVTLVVPFGRMKQAPVTSRS